MNIPKAAICGENLVFPAERLGCGKPIDTCAEVYRCTDCTTPFHRECAQKHFGEHSAAPPAPQEAAMPDVESVPEECRLTAHHTGDGWLLAVETPDMDDAVAYLAWPKSWPEEMTEDDLKTFGFEIV